MPRSFPTSLPVAKSTLTLLLLAAAGCESPLQAPTLRPETINTAKITTEAAEIEANIEGINPNDVELTARSVETKVNLGGKPDAAKVTLQGTVMLPAKQTVHLKLPIKVEWKDPATLTAFAATGAPVEYVVDGTAEFAAGQRSIKAPFLVRGSMPAAEVAAAAGQKPPPSAPPAPSASAAASAKPGAKPAGKR